MVLQTREGNSQAVDPGTTVAEEEVKIQYFPSYSWDLCTLPIYTETALIIEYSRWGHNEDKAPRIKGPDFYYLKTPVSNQSTFLNTCFSTLDW